MPKKRSTGRRRNPTTAYLGPLQVKAEGPLSEALLVGGLVVGTVLFFALRK